MIIFFCIVINIERVMFVSGGQVGQHLGDRRGGQGADQRHLHHQEPCRVGGNDSLRSVVSSVTEKKDDKC